uniref:BRO1 domain-containing protein n=1 Tax=Haemonchus contortus TaxID=6289 RepID=A0A7I4YHM4_HAECO|nr:BRO1 domain containing protein [Haemonchus contortus]
MNGCEEKPRNRTLLARALRIGKDPQTLDSTTASTQYSNQYGFLAVPLKTTNEVDLVKPLTTFFSTLFKGSSPNVHVLKEAIESFNRLRSRACCQTTQNNQSLANSLAEYYDQLTVFERKLEHSTAQHLEGFKWNDAFETGKSFFGKTQNSIADTFLERAAVLFNYGAALSEAAASQTFLTDGETKTAAKLFQQSAGVFAHLRDLMQLSMPKGFTTDLVPSTLTALSSIMLAQAQESFYRKAYAEKMNPSALVKIAAQTGDLYSEASKLMDISKGYWKKDWLNVVSGKAFGFQAIAELHQAQVNWERHEVGERLSRLKHALELVEKMKRRLQPTCFREQISEIENAYKSSTSDNRLIYHEQIPDYFTLPALPRAVLAKLTPVEKPLCPTFKDVFAAVVPETTMAAMKKFEQMKAEQLQKLKNRLSEQTELMDCIVASLNAPDVIPEKVKRSSSEVKETGGAANMRRKLYDLTVSHKRNSDMLAEIDRVLVEENRSDIDLRRQLRSDRVRITSEELVGPFVQEISKHLGDLKEASEVDKVLQNRFDSNEKAIDMLSKSERELRSLIPVPPSQLSKKASETTSTLLKLLDRAKMIKHEREDIVKEILSKLASPIEAAEKAEMNDILNINDEDYITKHVGKSCQPLEELVNSSLEKQECLLRDIEKWSARFSFGNDSETSSQRRKMLRSLQLGYEAFKEIQQKLDDKIKFYNTQAAALRRLQVKVNDFAFARQTEKEELLRGRRIFESSRRGAEPSLLASAPSLQPQQFNPPPFYPAATFVQGAAYTNGMAPPPLLPAQPQYTYPQYPYYGVTQPTVQPAYDYSIQSATTTTTSSGPNPQNYPTYPAEPWNPN